MLHDFLADSPGHPYCLSKNERRAMSWFGFEMHAAAIDVVRRNDRGGKSRDREPPVYRPT
jgi:hypothetical protein